LGHCGCELEAYADLFNPDSKGTIDMAKGKGLLPFIKEAKKSLYLTHFTAAQYTKEYVKAHVAQLKADIICARVVRIDRERPEDFGWLRAFFGKDGKPIGKYKHYDCVHDNLFPDIAIIDRKRVAFIRHRIGFQNVVQDKIALVDNAGIAEFLYEDLSEKTETMELVTDITRLHQLLTPRTMSAKDRMDDKSYKLGV
jgi:hypothetical protein